MKSVKKPKFNRVTVKVALPKDSIFRVLGSLITELWDVPLAEGKLTVSSVSKCNEAINCLRHAVRKRSVELLASAFPYFQPRCMLEMIGSSAENAAAFFVFYQLGSFLKKYPFKGTDTRKPAIEKFIKAERVCRDFNKENYRGLVSLNEKHPDFLGVIEEIQRDVCELLGEEPNLGDVIEHATHGPGVSLSRSYRDGKTTSYYKWSTLPYSLTSGALPLAKTAICTDPQWVGALDDWYRRTTSVPLGKPIDLDHFWSTVLQLVDGSRTTTVPKSYDTDRTIAIEPVLNVYFQLGVDRLIRKRLVRKWGFDLNTQERNQILAKEASITNELVTVDLSMASDLISLKICELFLPPAWYDLLCSLRCPETDVDGVALPLAKMSSMGNGFTFALESLIFSALVRCSIRRTKSERKCAVFGDDIIVPVTAYPFLRDLLSYVGFVINKEKSYDDGPFRESCGKDYFLGHDVRPVFLKRALTGLQDVLYLHNALYNVVESCPWFWEIEISKTLRMIRRWIPKNIQEKYYGPPAESLDTHLFSKRKLRRNGFGERFYWVIRTQPRIFNRGTEFFFRKLMCRPKPLLLGVDRKLLPIKERIQALFRLDEEPILNWDYRRRLATGNAFDVTKRDKVLLCSAKVRLL